MKKSNGSCNYTFDEIELAAEFFQEVGINSSDFTLYDPTKEFYSRKNIHKYPEMFLSAAESIRLALEDRGIGLQKVRNISLELATIEGRFNKIYKAKLEYKKALDFQFRNVPLAAMTLTKKLKFVMERISLTEVLGCEPSGDWIDYYIVNAACYIQSAFVAFEYIKQGRKYASKNSFIKDEIIFQAKNISSDYFNAASKAIESVSFAEALVASKDALSRNNSKAASFAHNDDNEFKKQYLPIYEKKYRHQNLTYTLAAKKLVKIDLKENSILKEKLLKVEENDYSPGKREALPPERPMVLWLSRWNRWQNATGGCLNTFLNKTIKQIDKEIKNKKRLSMPKHIKTVDTE